MKRTRPQPAQRSAIVIVAVLVIVSLLALAAYQYSDLMLLEYRAADSAARAQQARAFADSGVYYTAAVLANPDTMSGMLGGNPYDNAGAFQSIAVDPNQTNTRRQGRFTVYGPPDPDATSSTGQGVRYGVTDEASKINPNALVALDSSGEVAKTVLMKLPDMTEEAADSIIDWIDADDEQRTAGAENTYYSSQIPGYLCKNRPLDSLEELLLVKGVSPDLLFGTDSNRNGVEDDNENDGSGWSAGWAAYLTIYSREPNVDSEGNPRTFLNETDLKTSHETLTTALGKEMANFIILYRTQQQPSGNGDSGGGGGPGGDNGGNSRTRPASEQEMENKVNEALQQQPRRSVSSIFALIDASVTWTVPEENREVTLEAPNPLKDSAQQMELLPTLLDKTTTQQTADLPARVNMMTASSSVLAALPNLTEEDVQAIITARPAPDAAGTDPLYQTIAWLKTDADLSTEKLQAIERYATSRTQVYRVQVLGFFDQPGPTARVEAVIDTNNGRPRIVMYRDLTELGRGLSQQ